MQDTVSPSSDEKWYRGPAQFSISPMVLEAVKRIDALIDIERGINGRPAEERLKVRKEMSPPLMAELESWMREERAKLSKHAAVAEPMDYRLRRWDGFARFLEDGRIFLTNNAAERALRGLALGRESWLFPGSDRGGERAAVMYTMIGTAKLNDIDLQARRADVLKRIAEHPERSFALMLDRGGIRRTWLRGRDNVQKRYLIHDYKAHVGADADTALVEKLAVTPSNAHDARNGDTALPDNPGDV